MRSVLRGIMLACVIVCVTSPAAAQSARPLWTPSVSAGLVVPRGDVQTFTRTGYTVGASLDAALSGVPVGLRAEGGYTTFSFFRSNGNSLDGDRRQWNGGLALVLPVRTRVATPYLVGGYGLYQVAVRPDCTELNILDSATSPSCPGQTADHAGWSAGLGVDLPGDLLGSRIEARYTRIAIPGGAYSFVPVTFALRF